MVAGPAKGRKHFGGTNFVVVVVRLSTVAADDCSSSLHTPLSPFSFTHLDTLVAAALAAAHADPPQEASVPIREPSEPPEAGRVVFSSAISIVFFFSFAFVSLFSLFAAPLSLSPSLSHAPTRAQGAEIQACGEPEQERER